MKRAILFCCAVLAVCASCEKVDHAVNQFVTVYPAITLAEGSTVVHQVGTPWKDPGVKAVLEGNDITHQLTIVDEVDPDVSGIYTVTYSFVNKDGFPSNSVRTVIVYDVANANPTDISGTYNSSLVEDSDGWSPKTYPVKITKGPGTGLFYIADLFCGFWETGREYGPSYAFKAFIQLNLDNTIDILSVTNDWEGTVAVSSQLDGCHYDPETGNVVMHWAWTGWQDSFVCTYSK